MESKLKEILNERMIKQTALAERVNINRRTLSKIVRGEQEPTLRTALKIAKALGVPVEEIWKE